jgi:hypothetical protein
MNYLTSKIATTSEKYEVYFNIYQSECIISWKFTSKIATTSKIETSLLQIARGRARSSSDPNSQIFTTKNTLFGKS